MLKLIINKDNFFNFIIVLINSNPSALSSTVPQTCIILPTCKPPKIAIADGVG